MLEAFSHLMTIRGDCASKVCEKADIAEMTVKQINYLKIIDRHDNMTFSKLAEIAKITKPSVSDLVNKLQGFNCVYKEKCTADGRVSYIRLTEKGMKIARKETTAVKNLIERVMKSLNDEEVGTLIELFNKVK
ncbi:MAG: MarR family transcriptional regulator [Chloroflexia bacterium]|nr:MarR family transcriptional regulator [Chloroflexia bacterium]